MAKKGRDSKLIQLRDEKLCERFVYHYEVCKIRLDEVLRILSEEEFFLSEQRIWCIIKQRRGILTPEYVAQVKKPKVRAVRGVPTSVRVVSEYAYTFFPSSAPQ